MVTTPCQLLGKKEKKEKGHGKEIEEQPKIFAYLFECYWQTLIVKKLHKLNSSLPKFLLLKWWKIYYYNKSSKKKLKAMWWNALG